MGIGVGIVRIAAAVAALWFVAAAYQHVMTRVVGETMASNTVLPAPDLNLHPVDLSSCAFTTPDGSAGAQGRAGGCGPGVPQGQGVIPAN